ncbi:MAG: RNHCP domain-containing protein [Candidatus Dojkabacteria bacterium]|nr:RNHCP domain-containing protein [Candidatus Dojkabacteria bacterium]
MKTFTRTQETFTCEVCGAVTHGNGYTDHCPNCLWSKHVDVNPGDRRATCRGLMEPIGCTTSNKTTRIHYRCTVCAYRHQVTTAPGDNQEAIQKISQNPIPL